MSEESRRVRKPISTRSELTEVRKILSDKRDEQARLNATLQTAGIETLDDLPHDSDDASVPFDELVPGEDDAEGADEDFKARYPESVAKQDEACPDPQEKSFTIDLRIYIEDDDDIDTALNVPRTPQPSSHAPRMDDKKNAPPGDWIPPHYTKPLPSEAWKRVEARRRREKRDILLGWLSLLVIVAALGWFVTALIISPTFRWTLIIIGVIFALFGGLTWMIRVVLGFLSDLFGGRL